MPPTTTVFSRLRSSSSTARKKAPVTMPMPQPGHQMCGSRSVCRNCSISKASRALAEAPLARSGGRRFRHSRTSPPARSPGRGSRAG